MLLNPYRFSPTLPTLTSSLLAVSTTHSDAVRFYKTSDYATYSVLPSPPSTDRVAFDFSPTGDIFVVANQTVGALGRFDIWSTGGSDNASTWTLLLPSITFPSGKVKFLKFSPDGQYLAVLFEAVKYIKVYNVSNWSSLPDTSITPSANVGSLGFSGDSTKLVVAGASVRYTFNVPAMTLAATYGIAGTGSQLAVHPTEDAAVFGNSGSPYVNPVTHLGVAITPALPAAQDSFTSAAGNSIIFANNGATLIAAGSTTLGTACLTIYDWATKTKVGNPFPAIYLGGNMAVALDKDTVSLCATEDAIQKVFIFKASTMTRTNTLVATSKFLAYSPY